MKIRSLILDFHKELCYYTNMIKRELQKSIEKLARGFPVVGLVGPRQSGKTTLLREMFPEYHYFNLERPDTLAFVENDPGAFIRGQSRVVIDEIQRFPALLSYIQAAVDERQLMGDFIVSGSENLLLSEKIGQSLAGRAAYATLLPFSFDEIKAEALNFNDVYSQLFTGFYPAVYSRKIDPGLYYGQYIATYVERDLRNIINIGNLRLFRKMLALLAGRIGQAINFQSLSNDVGVSASTIENWLSILEACYIVFRLQPYYNNFGKRHMKTAKIYFTDTGLACFLLGITGTQALGTHYLIGGLFENYCIAEIWKHITNRLSNAGLYYFRDSNGNEVDLIIEDGAKLIPVEIKSSGTFSNSFLKGLNYWKNLTGNGSEQRGYVLYTGDEMADTGSFALVNWRNVTSVLQ